MATSLIDICVNLMHQQFDKDRLEVLVRAESAGVHGVLLCADNLDTAEENLKLIKETNTRKNLSLPELLTTAGTHPHQASEWKNDDKDRLRCLLKERSIAAIGECGLDFYRDISPSEKQITCFQEQLEIACKERIPLFVHDRDSESMTNQILKSYKALPPTVIHCFTGTEKELHEHLDLGCYIGITGWITDPARGQTLRKIISDIPLNRMLIETDAPFLVPKRSALEQKNLDLPTSFRSSRNEPCFLPVISSFLASELGLETREILQQTTQNAIDFFGFNEIEAT